MALFKGLRDRAGKDGSLYRNQATYKGAGSQNPSFREPFITTELPAVEGERSPGDAGLLGDNTNFILRSGTLSRAGQDVSRITSLLFNTGRGRLFVAKQNVLSRTGVKTEASGILNEGAYLPTSTIAQVGVNGLGGHLIKQGLNPFRDTQGVNNILGLQIPNALGVNAYVSVSNQVKDTDTNRLVGFYNDKIINLNPNANFRPLGASDQRLLGRLRNVANTAQDITRRANATSAANLILGKSNASNVLTSYDGGPGSQVGVGKTYINMSAEQRTGKNNIRLDQSGFFSTATTPSKTDPNVKFKKFKVGSILDRANSESSAVLGGATNSTSEIPFYDYSVFNRSYYNLPEIEIRANQIINPNSSVSLTYQRLTDIDTLLEQTDGGIVDQTGNKLILKDTSVYQNGLDTKNPDKQTTLTQEQIRAKERNSSNKILPDFRSEVNNQDSDVINTSLDYERDNIETRVGLGDPGKKGIITDYQAGKRSPGIQQSRPVDKITALPLYKSYGVATSDRSKNDLVKFRIAAVDSTNPSKSVYMHFRAFLGSFVDSYNSEWTPQKYMGRAENFYKYGGFDRSISMNWTVPAQSKNELMIMYQKLNYLASNLTPDYVNDKYMGGPLVRLTVGGYLYEQYGFIENLTFSIPEQSPWEIAVPGPSSTSTTQGVKDDKSVKELPHIIEVSGFSFKPIHNFVPQKQKNQYEGDLLGSNKTLSQYGLQRYIALATTTTNASGYIVENTNPVKSTTQLQRIETPGIQKVPVKIKV